MNDSWPEPTLFIATAIALIAIGVDPNWSRASASQTMVLA